MTMLTLGITSSVRPRWTGSIRSSALQVPREEIWLGHGQPSKGWREFSSVGKWGFPGPDTNEKSAFSVLFLISVHQSMSLDSPPCRLTLKRTAMSGAGARGPCDDSCGGMCGASAFSRVPLPATRRRQLQPSTPHGVAKAPQPVSLSSSSSSCGAMRTTASEREEHHEGVICVCGHHREGDGSNPSLPRCFQLWRGRRVRVKNFVRFNHIHKFCLVKIGWRAGINNGFNSIKQS